MQFLMKIKYSWKINFQPTFWKIVRHLFPAPRQGGCKNRKKSLKIKSRFSKCDKMRYTWWNFKFPIFFNNYIEFAIKWQKQIVVKRLQFLTKTYWTSCIFGEIPPGFSPLSRHVVVFFTFPKLSEKMRYMSGICTKMTAQTYIFRN